MKLNYIAPINSLSYGIVSLNILKAAIRTGHEVALWPIGGGGDAPPEDHAMLREAFDRTRFFDRAAPCLRIWHQWQMDQMVGKGLHCGLPIFELDKFNDQELHHLRSLDLVFAPSQWAADVLRDNGINNVALAPFGVDRTIFNENPPACFVLPYTPPVGDSEEGLGLPEDGATTFLNIGKWEYRKGHDLLCKAFNHAFEANDDVRLIMCCHNPFLEQNKGNDEWHRWYTGSRLGRRGKILVLNQRLESQENLAALIHKADCGVFPSRAEGWGMGTMEMLSCGKHVITTDYAAHTEYCTKENAWLIPVKDKEVANDGIWFHGQGNWAKFEQEQTEILIEYMRVIHQTKQAGSLKVNLPGIETAKRFSWDATASRIFSSLS